MTNDFCMQHLGNSAPIQPAYLNIRITTKGYQSARSKPIGNGEIPASSFCTLGAYMPMVLRLGLVAADLPVKFVREFINSGVEISVRAFGEKITTLDMHIALRSLAFFLLCHVVHCQYDPDINHLVEMPGNAIKLAHDIAAKRWGDLKVVTTYRQVHAETPIPEVGTG